MLDGIRVCDSNILVLVVQLGRFEHSRNPQGCFSFFVRLLLLFRFFFLKEEFRVVSGEFLELDEEVS